MGQVNELLEREEKIARRMAYILGDFSAAAQALQELDRRRSNGESVCIFQSCQQWIVGPAPALEGESA